MFCSHRRLLNLVYNRNAWLTLSVLCFMVYMAACDTSWVGEANSIITQLAPAIGGILSLLMAFGVSKVTPADITIVQNVSSEAVNDLAKVKALIEQYSVAETAAKPGVLAQIETIVKTIVDNYSTILPSLHITDAATQAKVEAIVGLVESELESLLNVIPAIQGKMSLSQVVLPLNAKQFKKHYNRTMQSVWPKAAVQKPELLK